MTLIAEVRETLKNPSMKFYKTADGVVAEICDDGFTVVRHACTMPLLLAEVGDQLDQAL